MKQLLLLALVFLSFSATSQNLKKLILVDKGTQKTIPFENIIFDEETFKGTSIDIDGVFFVPPQVKSITISYVGYDTKTINIEELTSQVIFLQQKVNELDEVVINGENPAHRIIKLAVANKKINNPKRLEILQLYLVR
jgi:hypothetical protein